MNANVNPPNSRFVRCGLLRQFVVALIVVGFASLLASSSASAFVSGAILVDSWGTLGTGSGQLGIHGFDDGGIAVNDTTGDVYVADKENARIVEFNSSGAFVRTWGYGVVDGTNTRQVCNAPAQCREGIVGPGPGQFSWLNAIAVDNSDGPNAGDVYVVDSNVNESDLSLGNNTISKFSPTGAYLGEIDGSDTPHGPFQSLATAGALSVDSEGIVWIADRYLNPLTHNFEPVDGSRARIMRFSNQIDNKYTPGSEVGLPSAFITTLTVNGSGTQFYLSFRGVDGVYRYDPNGENVLKAASGVNLLAIDHETEVLYVARGDTIEMLTLDGDPIAGSAFEVENTNGVGPNRMAINSITKMLYVQEEGKVLVFAPRYLPNVETGSVLDLAHTSATLTGEIAPDPRGGGDVSECKVEYGITTSYGSEAPCSQALPISAPTQISAVIGGLATGKKYHYRVVASNANGANAGPDRTFVPPAVLAPSTDPASNITESSATLNGSFVGEGKDTHYYFQWGNTTSYGKVTAKAPGADAGSGSGSVSVSAQIEGLKFYKAYHYRLVVSNDLGTTVGPDRSFFTLPSATPGIADVVASAIGPREATIGATVFTGIASTAVQVEYGTDRSYGSRTVLSDPIGADNEPHPIEQRLTELTPGTVYHYRVVAVNFGGVSRSTDQTFMTPGPPLVSSLPAAAISDASARLEAQINPNASPTSYRFEYGLTEAYGSSTAETAVGGDASRHLVTTTIAGLSPASSYHFRVVATNGISTTVGVDQILTTTGAATALPPVGKRCKKALVRRKGKCQPKKHQKKHQSHRRGYRSHG